MSDSPADLDLTARLANRARASVPPRSKKSLLAGQPDANQLDNTKGNAGSDVNNLDDLSRAVENLPQMGKRIAVSLEVDLRAQLLRLCDSEGITPETFLEAAVAVLEQHPHALAAILAEAKLRYQQRKDAGHLRRTLTSLQKIQS